jgi:hypothetical protein
MAASGGVVYGPGSLTEGRFSSGVAIGAGGIVPPGAWFLPGAYTITVPAIPPATGTVNISCPGGFVISDGYNVTLTAAGTATKLGAGNPYVWPWPSPPV